MIGSSGSGQGDSATDALEGRLDGGISMNNGRSQQADAPGDHELVARVVARDVAAFTALYDRYAQAVYALAAHLIGPAEAEEIVQHVFLRLWERADQFDPARGPFHGWFMAIARHHILDRGRAQGQARRVQAVVEIDLLFDRADPTSNVEELVGQREASEVVSQALAQLPAEQRRVLLLAYVGGLSHSAIAARIDAPLGTVKKRIRLGLTKLRRLLRGQELTESPPPAPDQPTPEHPTRSKAQRS